MWGGVGQRRVHIKEKQPSVSAGSTQLVEEMQDVWTKTDKMEDDRKQISLPLPLLQEKRLTIRVLWCLTVSRCWLSSPPHSSHLPFSNLLTSLSFRSSLLSSPLLSSPVPSSAEWWYVTLPLDSTCFPFPRTRYSLLPRCLIWSFAFLLRSTRSKNVSSLTCRHAQELNYLYWNDHVIINTLYALIKLIMIAFTQCSFFFLRIGFFWT